MALRERHVLRWIAIVGALLVVVIAAWVLPVVYEVRYDPAGKDTGGSSEPAPAPALPPNSPSVVPPDPSSAESSGDQAGDHPVPTAEQDRIYLDQTQAQAAHPGLAVEGRDGYLFLGDAFMANFAQAMGRRFYSPDEIARTVGAVTSTDQWLRDRGIAAEFVVVPATWSVYADKMPEWTDGQRLPTILDQLVAADPTSFMDLRPELTAARATADTYSRLNSHWTPYGSIVGFRTMIDRLQADHPDLGSLPVPTVTGTTESDAFNEFAGITGAAGPNNWVVPQLASALPSYTVIAADGTRRTAAGDEFLDITQMPLQTENPAAGNDHRALILADSATSLMSPYLAAAFGSTMMVRHWADQPAQAPNLPALVESYRPDVVITLVSERNLNVVTPDTAMWQAAVAFDAGASRPLGEWMTGGAATLEVSGPDLSEPVTATLSAVPPDAATVRLNVQAEGPGTITVTSQTAAGPEQSSIRVAQGANVLFAAVPAAATEPALTITRTDGTGVWTLTGVTVRGR